MPRVKVTTPKPIKSVALKAATIGRGRKKKISLEVEQQDSLETPIPSASAVPRKKNASKNKEQRKERKKKSSSPLKDEVHKNPTHSKTESPPKTPAGPSSPPKLELILPKISPLKKNTSPSPDSPTPKANRKSKVSISDQLFIENTYSKMEYDRSPIVQGRVGKSKSKAPKINIRKLLRRAKVASPPLARKSSATHLKDDHENKNGTPFQFLSAMANVFTETVLGTVTSLIGHPVVAYNTDPDSADEDLFI